MGTSSDTRAELAGREGPALLFLAEKGWTPHGIPEPNQNIKERLTQKSFFE